MLKIADNSLSESWNRIGQVAEVKSLFIEVIEGNKLIFELSE
jgi:hypothetical protein